MKREMLRPGLIRLAGALAGSAVASLSVAETATTNAVALTMHATLVPEIHIVPPEEKGKSGLDPFSFYPDVVSEDKAACSNQFSFAIHARNLTMLELVDLICFLSETPYAFDGNRLVIAPTNMPAVQLKQNAKSEKELIAKMKDMTIPDATFLPPATIIDAFEFLYQASVDYDDPEIPVNQRGCNFAVKNPRQLTLKTASNVPRMCNLGSMCSLYDAVTQVCAKVNAQFLIRDNTVVIFPAEVKRRDEPGKGP